MRVARMMPQLLEEKYSVMLGNNLFLFFLSQYYYARIGSDQKYQLSDSLAAIVRYSTAQHSTAQSDTTFALQVLRFNPLLQVVRKRCGLSITETNT